MKIGVCIGSDKISEVKKAGADYIELPLAEIVNKSDDDFSRILADLKKSDIKCEAMNVIFPGSNILLIGDNNNSKVLDEYLDKAFKRVKELDPDILVLGSGQARLCPEGFSMQEAQKQIEWLTEKLGNMAAKIGTTIVIEPLNKKETNMINTVEDGFRLVEKVNHPNVKLLCDYYHMTMENEDVSVLKNCSSMLRHAHVAPYMEGMYPKLDYKVFFNTLKEIGYDSRVSIEGRITNFDEELKSAVNFLRSHIKFEKEFNL